MKLLLLLVGLSSAAFQKEDVGTAGAQFLKLGADARAAGMGGAVRAHAEDASAAYWNPAGLAALRHRHLTLTHASLYQSVFYDYIAYAHPVEAIFGGRNARRDLQSNQLGTLAFYGTYLSAGSLGEVDNTGTSTGGSFRPADMAFAAAWGGSITRDFDVGLAVKYISVKVKKSASTGAADAGARLRLRVLDVPWIVAVSARNVGGQLKLVDQGDELPTEFAVSQSIRPFRGLALTTDLVAPRDGKPYPCAGIEYRAAIEPQMSAALRAGYDGRTQGSLTEGLSRVTFGGGLGVSRFTFDYAFAPYGELGAAHRLSLSYRF